MIKTALKQNYFPTKDNILENDAKILSAVEVEPYVKDNRSDFLKAILNDFMEMALRISSGREFQQSTEL